MVLAVKPEFGSLTIDMNQQMYETILNALDAGSRDLERLAEKHPVEMDAAMQVVYEREERNNECQDCD